jgi:hypothetical protein
MSETQNKYELLSHLIQGLLSGELTDVQSQRLNQMLSKDPKCLQYYIEYTTLWGLLDETNGFSDDEDLFPGDAAAMLQALADEERTAKTITLPKKQEPPKLIRKVERKRIEYKINRGALLTIAVSIAAVVLIILFVRFAPPSKGIQVAVLVDTINAKWADAEDRMTKGDFINTGDKSLVLSEGYAEFLFNNQTKVTIEGPSEFQVLAEDQMRLGYGRLYAVVPRQAIGFTVKTPSAQIVDLGTEFGVETDLHRNTSLHVLRGKTVLIAGDKSNKASIEVKEGVAKQVSAATRTISDISCNNRLFAREIDSAGHLIWRGETAISLADIVGGGNGLGKVHSLIGLDPGTGHYTSSIDQRARSSKNPYNPVPDSKFIDGVFVPDGGQDSEIVISSLNDRFPCPDTRGNYTHDISVFTGDIEKQHSTIRPAVFGGHNYTDNQILMIHSNAGLTFDLQAIRQSLPTLGITHFKAFGGFSEALSVKTDFPDVDFWVVVDGQIRYEKKAITLKNNEVDFNIELSPQDRFLTLIVTDGSDSDDTNRGYKAWNNDFFYLVDPILCRAGASD